MAPPLFTLLLLGCLCLLTTACNGDSGDAPHAKVAPEPSALFSQHAPVPPAPKVLRLLVVGDSLSISLGEQLERALTGAVGIDFARDGTRSTGLTRPELLNWPVHLRELVTRQGPPDVVVIMIGANDVMPVDDPDGSRVSFNSPTWPEAYAAKAKELVDICRTANPKARVYWVGVPAMGEASLASGAVRINAALATMCAATPGCRFIDTQAAFCDTDGHFCHRGRDEATGDQLVLRTADGVHMTENGAKLLAGVVLATLANREKLPPIAGVDELRAFARDMRPLPDVPVTAPASATKAPAKGKASGKTYSVKKGDTILGVARRLGVSAKALADVNPGVDSNHLSLGQTLRLPAKHH